ncbi:hypothetical protein RF11_14326 [Thelohanellus kitauei]|uniref:Uncharacterized protein n=1 Tax=Thelohanellus kitauei TaxID=669202 RepID=A0A0C2N142_THEKT|nr:hypothetical protein RF11_14326 [Thelohanellus kitauei]
MRQEELKSILGNTLEIVQEFTESIVGIYSEIDKNILLLPSSLATKQKIEIPFEKFQAEFSSLEEELKECYQKASNTYFDIDQLNEQLKLYRDDLSILLVKLRLAGKISFD